MTPLPEESAWPGRVIVSSHLALRFYRSAGWTEADVRALLVKGDVQAQRFSNEDDVSYWLITTGSRLDADRVLAEKGPIYNYKDELLETPGARRGYVERMNW